MKYFSIDTLPTPFDFDFISRYALLKKVQILTVYKSIHKATKFCN